MIVCVSVSVCVCVGNGCLCACMRGLCVCICVCVDLIGGCGLHLSAGTIGVTNILGAFFYGGGVFISGYDGGLYKCAYSAGAPPLFCLRACLPVHVCVYVSLEWGYIPLPFDLYR